VYGAPPSSTTRTVVVINQASMGIVGSKSSTVSSSSVLYTCQSSVASKEKLECLLCGSYDGVGDGHCAVIHCVRKCWRERLIFQSFMHCPVPRYIWEVPVLERSDVRD
jgi:hypothetical protein